jgi:hypothetical protein
VAFGEALVSERDNYPDPVLRVKDAMDLHAIAMSEGATAGGYAVFSLQTGVPITNDLYPSRGDARRMAEKRTTDALLILEAQPDGMPFREAEAVLKYERVLYSTGHRTPDSLETEQNSGLMSMPRTKSDRRRMVKQLVSGRPITPDGPYGNLPHFLRKGL